MENLLFILSYYGSEYNSILAGVGGVVILLLLAAFIIPLIFYLITLQNTLHEVSPENRKMRPGQVWLCLIPLFGTVWNFFIVGYIADSLKLEFNKRNIKVEDRPGYSIGLTYSILGAVSYIPFIGGLAALGYLVLWIIYWIKINEFKLKLQQNQVPVA